MPSLVTLCFEVRAMKLAESSGELGSEHEEPEPFLDLHPLRSPCSLSGVKHAGLQDEWCAAKSASRTSGVELAGLVV